ncbi:hypothetical protein R9X49_04730 [Pectobacterium carotovorum]|uniref:hypothetical protein n=1 Tax=Pectobacterium carotovorum TaxID=554 RepID=UPI0029DA929D|nr:hypothetical protein [Pectobacterium carotovorum]MDX6914404.1 hypothetical protein [Pectobacterium carotovorum]
MLKIPKHMRGMIEVTAHQVANVMAGHGSDNTSITYCTDDYLPDSVPHYQESEIESYLQTIFQAVRFGIIKPIRASHTSAWGDTTNIWTTQIDVDTIDRNTQIHDATFLAADIWPWANQLLSDDSPWYGFSDPKKDLPLPENWGEFANRDTALLLIAGLSKALEGKSGGVYKWGNKLNQKKLAEDAALAVGSVLGENTPDKTESFRKLIAEALAAMPAN